VDMRRGVFVVFWCIALIVSVAGCGSDEDLAEAIYTAGHGDVGARVWIPINESRSTGTYRAEVEWGDGVTGRVEGRRDGMIAGVWMDDVTGSGWPELVVATASAGSGTYGSVRIFGRAGVGLDPVRVSPLSEAQRAGYMGHDVFSVEAGRVRRSHPLYREGDSNASPSGGEAVYYYSFADSAWVVDGGDATGD